MFVLGSMSENSASAMIARRGERVDRTFETIEDVSRAAQRHLKCFVVGIAADFAGFHM